MALIKFDPTWNRFAKNADTDSPLPLNKINSVCYDYDRALFLDKMVQSKDQPLENDEDFTAGRIGIRTRVMEIFETTGKNEKRVIAKTVVYTLRTFTMEGVSTDYPTSRQTTDDLHLILGCPIAAVQSDIPPRSPYGGRGSGAGADIPVVETLADFTKRYLPE